MIFKSNSKKVAQQQRQEKLDTLREELNKIIKKAERMGEEGKIDEAQDTLESADKLRTECKQIEAVKQNLISFIVLIKIDKNFSVLKD